MTRMTIIFLLICGTCYADTLPNPAWTPGDVLPVTAEQVCVPGYSKTARNVSEETKKAVYKEYSQNSKQSPCPCEVDHLISLQLGGSNDIKNLWPQSYQGEWSARRKDALENHLHYLVCAGNVDLKVAQEIIARDWTKAYEMYGVKNIGNQGTVIAEAVQ